MEHDATFRLVLLAGFLAVMPIGIYHRVRSQSTGEKLDRREEGLFILLTLRPIGIASMAGFVAFLINPSWMGWASVGLPVWLRWTGVAVGALAASILVWTFRTLDRNLTDTVVTRKHHSMVTNGPYRWIRHPFYVGFALAVVANGLATANWFILLTGTVAFGLIVMRTKKEEEHLVARFGERYTRYMKQTGRFFPRRAPPDS